MKERYGRAVFKRPWEHWMDSLEDKIINLIHSDWCPGDIRCWNGRQYWLLRNSQNG